MLDAKNGFLGGLELAQENVTTAGPVMFQLLPRTAALSWDSHGDRLLFSFLHIIIPVMIIRDYELHKLLVGRQMEGGHC